MANYIQTRLTNPSNRSKKMAQSRRRRSSTSSRRRTPVRVSVRGTSSRRKRLSNPSRKRLAAPARRRRSNPSRRASSVSRTRRRNPTRRRRTSTTRRRRNPAFDFKSFAVATVGFGLGAFVSGRINDWMDDTFAKGDGSEKAKKALGVIKILGSVAIYAAANYVKQNPRMLGTGKMATAYGEALDNFAVAGSAVALASGIELLFKAGETAYPTSAAGSRRRRRNMRGVIVSSPTLANQLATARGSMRGTGMLGMNPAMRGSLEVYPTPQPALQQMQGGGSYYGGGLMSSTHYGGGHMSSSAAYGSCI